MDHDTTDPQGVLQQVAIMLIQKHYTNARDKLLNLQHRFPNLHNISEMLTVTEILSSADLKFPAYEIDWYWILQLPPVATQSDIRTSFLKFTSLLQPLKNEFPGATSALELISHAFSVLSNADKRSIFDSNTALALGNTQQLNININDELVSETEDVDEDFEKVKKAESFQVGQVWAVYDEENIPRRYARINGIDMFGLCISWLKSAPDSIDERRWCEVGLPVACGFFQVQLDEFRVTELEMFSHVMVFHSQPVSPYRVEIRPKINEVWAIYQDWEPRKWCLVPQERELSLIQMVEILTNYSTNDDDDDPLLVVGLVQVEGQTNVFKRCRESDPFTIPSTHLFRFSHNVSVLRSTIDKDETWFEVDPRAVPDIIIDSPSEPRWPKQVWAVYDGPGPDSMPRQYVIVNKVISETEVSVTMLEPYPTIDDEIEWIEENLPVVCGSFRESKTTCSLYLSRLSHLVECQRSRIIKSFYMIYPKKGEIWAVYRNWNSRWNQSDFCMYECEIVEIITDWGEEQHETMEISSLVQVPGYLTFFQREICDGVLTTQSVSRPEMLCFSHRILGFCIPMTPRIGLPEGSWHLEPDALPPKRKLLVKS